MAENESTMLAQLSSTRAALDRLLAGIASAGDYTHGGKTVRRADLLRFLTDREKWLSARLDEIPAEEISTMDWDASTLGEIDAEYVEET